MSRHPSKGALALAAALVFAVVGTTTALANAQPGRGINQAPTTNLKIGVVTDIGSLDDKNFNQYSYKGAQDGATALGLDANVPYVVSGNSSEYANNIQLFVDAGFNVIVTIGFNMAAATAQAAHDNPDVWFVGVDQSPICVDETGVPDSKFACKGDAATLLPNYISVNFAEDQAGYLAGIVAASISKSGTVAAIGGTSACAPCVRYIQGYELGAKSVNPNAKVISEYVVSDFSNTAFYDLVAGKNFAEQLLQQNPDTDVMFQVAGLTGNGVLQAACAAGAYGIGVDVDQYLSLNVANDPTYGCLVTSATKNLVVAVSQAIQQIGGGTAKAGDVRFDATNDGIGVAPAQGTNAALITPDIQAKIDAAIAAMKAGTLTTCPPAPNCGVVAPSGPAPSAAPSGS